MSDELQFERAEYREPETRLCAICSGLLVERYWVVNGKPLCASCQGRVVGQFNVGTPGRRFLAALGFGTVGGAVGAGVYYAVRAITGYELGLVAIVVGLLVGLGVKRGARGRGGAGYQALAMGLTYLSIVATYVPIVLGEIEKAAGHSVGMFGTIFAVIFSLIAPIYLAFKAPLSAIITGIALYEAWKVNKRPALAITGPHALAPAPAATTPESTPATPTPKPTPADGANG
jgi:hypothetical protein